LSVESGNNDVRYLSIQNQDEDIDRTYSISKYPSDDRPFILSRTARITLYTAYCNALLDIQDASGAIRTISRLRNRIDFVDIDNSGLPDGDEKVLQWIENTIIDELAYESGFEGQRWYDLMRVAERRNSPKFLADQVAQKYPEESRAEIRKKLMNKNNWFIPVFE
jgi:hypothetical protein